MRSTSFLFQPSVFLRAEACCESLAALGAYHMLFPHHWLIFVSLFFVPDLSLLVYMLSPNLATCATYNVMHTYLIPALLGMLAVGLHRALLGKVVPIWIAHISLDRVLGYGLKYPLALQFTRLRSAPRNVS